MRPLDLFLITSGGLSFPLELLKQKNRPMSFQHSGFLHMIMCMSFPLGGFQHYFRPMSFQHSGFLHMIMCMSFPSGGFQHYFGRRNFFRGPFITILAVCRFRERDFLLLNPSVVSPIGFFLDEQGAVASQTGFFHYFGPRSFPLTAIQRNLARRKNFRAPFFSIRAVARRIQTASSR